MLNLEFLSITDNPNYLPAIFSLCVMGMLQDDETLTAAALQELAKVSISIACKFYFFFCAYDTKNPLDDTDKEQHISWLFYKFHQLQVRRVTIRF